VENGKTVKEYELKYKTNKYFVKASKYLNQGKLRKALKIFKKLDKKGVLDCGLNIGLLI